jgi:hypothetical protein
VTKNRTAKKRAKFGFNNWPAKEEGWTSPLRKHQKCGIVRNDSRDQKTIDFPRAVAMITLPPNFISPCLPLDESGTTGGSVIPRIKQLEEQKKSVKATMERRGELIAKSHNEWDGELKETLNSTVTADFSAAILDKYLQTTKDVATAVLTKDKDGAALAMEARGEVEGKLYGLLGRNLAESSQKLLEHCLHLSAQDQDQKRLEQIDSLLKEADDEKEEYVKAILGENYDKILAAEIQEPKATKRKSVDDIVSGRDARRRKVAQPSVIPSKSKASVPPASRPFATMNIASIRQELGFVSKETIQASNSARLLRKVLLDLKDGGFHRNPCFVKYSAKNEVLTSNQSLENQKKRLIHFLFDGPAMKSA